MLMQVVIIVAVVTPFSFDLHIGGVVLGAALLCLFSVGVGALSFALALASKGQDWMFWTVQQTLLFPVLLTAGVLLPMDGAPRWLEVVSSLNPMTYVVEAVRALFAAPTRDHLGPGSRGCARRRRPRPRRRHPGDAPGRLTVVRGGGPASAPR